MPPQGQPLSLREFKPQTGRWQGSGSGVKRRGLQGSKPRVTQTAQERRAPPCPSAAVPIYGLSSPPQLPAPRGTDHLPARTWPERSRAPARRAWPRAAPSTCALLTAATRPSLAPGGLLRKEQGRAESPRSDGALGGERGQRWQREPGREAPSIPNSGLARSSSARALPAPPPAQPDTLSTVPLRRGSPR